MSPTPRGAHPGRALPDRPCASPRGRRPRRGGRARDDAGIGDEILVQNDRNRPPPHVIREDALDDLRDGRLAVQRFREEVHRAPGQHEHCAVPAIECARHRVDRPVAAQLDEQRDARLAQVRSFRQLVRAELELARDRPAGLGKSVLDLLDERVVRGAAARIVDKPDCSHRPAVAAPSRHGNRLFAKGRRTGRPLSPVDRRGRPYSSWAESPKRLGK